jgi:hypothetical protein
MRKWLEKGKGVRLKVLAEDLAFLRSEGGPGNREGKLSYKI